MKILINQQSIELSGTGLESAPAVVADALSAFNARPPFAVAVNGQFVPRSRYASQALSEGDRLDVVQPVAGG